MHKFLILVFVTALFISGSTVYAAKNEIDTQNEDAQVQNQNQVQTQNENEDSQLKVNTQEQEAIEDKSEHEEEVENDNQEDEGMPKDLSPRSETAEEHMSIVSQKVEELLTTEATQNGIGEQIKQIAQEQKEAQSKIQEELNKIDNRGRLLKLLIGPDFKSLNTMQQQMELNQLRIQQLQQLQNQLTNQSDITIIQETIQALTDQNTALQNRINLEQQSKSLLGWFFTLLAE